MKTLIIYATTYDFAKECAGVLQEELEGDVDTVNIEKEEVPSLEGYHQVVIGGSIYMGQLDKKLKEYCVANLETLLEKRIGLFICCGFVENFEEHLKNSFPAELLEKATAVECFGGELRVDRMKIAHKLLTKVIKKATKDQGTEPAGIPENISRLATILNDASKEESHDAL